MVSFCWLADSVETSDGLEKFQQLAIAIMLIGARVRQ